MRELGILVIAAVLEVGGDALVRWGIQGGKVAGFALGALLLFGYGAVVNAPGWDFGRLLGIYIAVFYVVSQVMAYWAFKVPVKAPVLLGGAFIVTGGMILAFWKPA